MIHEELIFVRDSTEPPHGYSKIYRGCYQNKNDMTLIAMLDNTLDPALLDRVKNEFSRMMGLPLRCFESESMENSYQ